MSQSKPLNFYGVTVPQFEMNTNLHDSTLNIKRSTVGNSSSITNDSISDLDSHNKEIVDKIQLHSYFQDKK
jgi:hypothetical protein